MKKIALTLSTIFMTLTLMACSNQSKLNKSHENVSSTSSSKATSTDKETKGDKKQNSIKVNPKHNQVLWNQDKARQLESFMQRWQAEMKQNYTSYYPGKDVNYYGIKYPTALNANNIAVNKIKATLSWSTTGKGKSDFNVVAIYSDAENTKMGAHLYFFTIASNGKPVVLFTNQNQGTPDMLVHFAPTQNADLEKGFDQIVDTNIQ
ncbi:DUF4767 domain-containing protein [Pediococcus claussenii]|nr:DUF4767 domain-containing protein [Pediococcus claussenii]ANZ69603.1 hypothetical protein AYR57_04415 [Pediococcus claussenii]ANZ71420.1 hypothetical protein AYR58_04420 [Pediococcus claussenii]KRN19356.1 hypothetical protein IV79_GL001406 [Pediococcus claussenii]